MMNRNLLLLLLFMSILGSATSLRLQKLKEDLEPTLEFADDQFNDDGLSIFGDHTFHFENNKQQGSLQIETKRNRVREESNQEINKRNEQQASQGKPNVMGPVHQQGVPKCMISSRGRDGFGHQLFAKLSCMAVAETLGMKYIHTPFEHTEHGEVGSSFNDYLGLDKVVPNLESITNVIEATRQPIGKKGKCGSSSKSWLRDLANGRQQCAHDGVTVYTGDNCWNFFYCHSVSWADQWYKVQPRVQKAFLESSKNYSVDMEKQGPNDKQVVLHIRRGDAENRMLPNKYYHNVIDMLREEFEKDGKNVTFRIETDGYKKDFQSFRDKGVIVEDRTGSLKKAFRRMVTADVFVASQSSFSESAAVLSSGQVIWPECGECGMILKYTLPPTWRLHPCN